MSFIHSYKHLEKLCGEIMNDSRCVSAYIDEMQNTPQGAYYVPSWNEDLRLLKHYRWVRNQIVHEPDCDEQNMCVPGDALWLEQFHSRIMNQTDPLSLYRKATTHRNKPASTPAKVSEQGHSQTPSATDTDTSAEGMGCLKYLILVLLIIFAIGFVFYMLLHS